MSDTESFDNLPQDNVHHLPAPPTPLNGSGYSGLPMDPESVRERQRQRQLAEAKKRREQEYAAILDRNAEILWEQKKLQRYRWQGEMLRQNHLEWRQDQHCELCGYQFNYWREGEPKHENDWCRTDKEHCGEGDDPSCLDRQNARKRANRKARHSNTTATKAKGKGKGLQSAKPSPDPLTRITRITR